MPTSYRCSINVLAFFCCTTMQNDSIYRAHYYAYYSGVEDSGYHMWFIRSISSLIFATISALVALLERGSMGVDSCDISL